jgi:ADP-heptose:LPS heptosyltransferase
MTVPLLLVNHQGAGDVVVTTGIVRDIATAWPGRFRIGVDTPCAALWENNPHIDSAAARDPDAIRLAFNFPFAGEEDRLQLSMADTFRLHVSTALHLPVPPSECHGDIHLSSAERFAPPAVPGRYWLVTDGAKGDMPLKLWPTRFYQEVVDYFSGRLTFVQVGGAGNYHPRLNGAVDLVGKTGLRNLVKLVYHAAGTLSPPSFLMHLAASVPTPDGSLRPAVVLHGGRETPAYTAYPGHRAVSTVGLYDCCRTGGCWRSKPAECRYPVQVGAETVGRCMAETTPDEVIPLIDKWLAHA